MGWRDTISGPAILLEVLQGYPGTAPVDSYNLRRQSLPSPSSRRRRARPSRAVRQSARPSRTPREGGPRAARACRPPRSAPHSSECPLWHPRHLPRSPPGLQRRGESSTAELALIRLRWNGFNELSKPHVATLIALSGKFHLIGRSDIVILQQGFTKLTHAHGRRLPGDINVD